MKSRPSILDEYTSQEEKGSPGLSPLPVLLKSELLPAFQFFFFPFYSTIFPFFFHYFYFYEKCVWGKKRSREVKKKKNLLG